MEHNPFQSPEQTGYVPAATETGTVEYVGFLSRLGALIIDSILAAIVGFIIGLVVLAPLAAIGLLPENEFVWQVVNYLVGMAIVVAFWVGYGATPGKMMISARIVDARTGAPLTVGQGVLRYIGYFVSGIVCLLGYFWAGFHPRKQAWHDIIANTVVIRAKPGEPHQRFMS